MNPQRFLVAAGLGSRRACDKLIKEGRVTVNGQPLVFGMELGEGDDVRVDGRPLRAHTAQVYLVLNKPAGYISDRGSHLHPSALDLVKIAAPGLHAAGRLDQDATGLLFLTNDGELSYRLTHPKFEHEKEYRVLVEGIPNGEDLQRWRDGVLLHGETEKTAKAEVSLFGPRAREGADASNTWLRVILHEGRKRQIKRVAKHIGHPVIELQRVRMGRLKLGDLPIGQWRHLTEKEVGELKGS